MAWGARPTDTRARAAEVSSLLRFAVPYIALEETSFGENDAGLESTPRWRRRILSRAPFGRVITRTCPQGARQGSGLRRSASAAIARWSRRIAMAGGPARSRMRPSVQRRYNTRHPPPRSSTRWTIRRRQQSGLLGAISTPRPTVQPNSCSLRSAASCCTRRPRHHRTTTSRQTALDTPIFNLLARALRGSDGFNERGGGTIRYNLNDSYSIGSRKSGRSTVTRWLARRLRP